MVMLPVLDKKGKESSQLNLSDDIFGQKVNQDLLHQAILMYQASLRQGTVSTKERGDVNGGGKKPYRQKGTGRARQGTIRAPQFIGGGIVFGPHPRDFSYTLPKKIKRAALRESLNAKYHSKQLVFINEFTDKFTKTKDFALFLKTLNLKGKVLALLDGCDPSIELASRNIPRFEMMRTEDVNAYDILRNKYLLLTKTALDKLMERITK
ncbi:MAG: 50S ribosomal protein L4 [Candidatus Omnitrophota bacterium]